MARVAHGSRRLCTDAAGVPSGLQHRRRALRLCRRPGVALRRLAIAGDGSALAAHHPDRARLAEYVSADGHAVLFGVVWLVAAVLALVGAGLPVPWRRLIQAFALLLVALGVLLRPNAIFAAPFLAAYVFWPTRFDVRRMAIIFLPAVV